MSHASCSEVEKEFHTSIVAAWNLGLLLALINKPFHHCNSGCEEMALCEL